MHLTFDIDLLYNRMSMCKSYIIYIYLHIYLNKCICKIKVIIHLFKEKIIGGKLLCQKTEKKKILLI